MTAFGMTTSPPRQKPAMCHCRKCRSPSPECGICPPCRSCAAIDGCPNDFWGAQNPANGCAIDDASCGQQGNFWDGSSGVPKSPLWNISEMQADELAYEKSMYGADNVVTGPNGWPAQNTSCRSVPRVGYRLAVPVYGKTVAAIVRAQAWVQSGRSRTGKRAMAAVSEGSA
jgi:hypothetical protein